VGAAVTARPPHHPTPRYDVVIAGAGPAGAAVALRLAQAGLRVVAVDRAAFPREKACSEYMSPEGVRHLAALGVLQDVERQGGNPIRGTTVHAPRGSSLTGIFARAAPVPFRETGLSVSRRILDHTLVAAARRAGAEIREQTSVRAVLRDGAAVSGLLVRDEAGTSRELRARLTIGADGLHSRVARTIGVRHTGFLRRYALVAHVTDVPGLDDTAEMHVTREGYVGLNPLGGGLANVALVLPKAQIPSGANPDQAGRAAARGPSLPLDRFFLEKLARFPGVRGRIGPRAIVRPVLVTGPFAVRTSPVITAGAVLVGDAADFFDPFTGEGICAALRGAQLIEQTLLDPLRSGEPLHRSALRDYVVARRRAFLGKWIVERLIGYAMLAPSLFDRAVERLERRGLSHTLIGVTGDFLPARAVLNPIFLSQVML